MNGFDIASAVVFAATVVYVITASRRKVTNGRHLFRSVTTLTIVALATALLATEGRLSTTLFVELTACMLFVAAVLHAFAWSRWLSK